MAPGAGFSWPLAELYDVIRSVMGAMILYHRFPGVDVRETVMDKEETRSVLLRR